ncbi:MAG: MEDS domain-containing protein [Acidobacteriota bacterium]|nr:MEDS domain-containing protein [Acidobacteriota bacterium]
MNATGEAILTHPDPQGHFVYPYTNETQFSEAVCLFIGSGLRSGGSALLVMTDFHCTAVRKQLREDGLDVAELETCGRSICKTAESLLSTFMFDGIIDDDHFKSTIGRLIESARANSSNGEVRVFGEMVDLIWIPNPAATQRLEELWNQVIKLHSVPLLCAYSLGGSRPEVLPQSLLECHSGTLA